MPSTDLALDLALRGYLATSVGSRGATPDATRARLLGRPALVVRGPDGVRFFTDTSVVQRESAMPAALAHTLFGRGAVHTLDDSTHRHRKRLFVRALREPAVDRLVTTVREGWEAETRSWGPAPVAVEDRAAVVIGRSVLAWAGVEVPAGEAEVVARRLALVVDGFGVPGPPFLRAVRARRQLDAWAEAVVGRARTDPASAPRGAPLQVVSRWTDDDGTALPLHTAGVELLNLLRPTVAVSRFVGFAALALAQHPSWRRRLADEAGGAGRAPGPHALAFAHEVRRLAPFVPVLAGIARREATFRGHRVPVGTRVVLDVLGTNTDERWWPRPLVFDPQRFLGGQHLERDALVPQGGGLVAEGHRCPGEDSTLGILAFTAAQLAVVRWRLPPQRLAVSWRRIPTRPGQGVRLVVDPGAPQ